MTLQTKLKTIGDALAATCPNTYHYYRPQMQLPYCVWQEDGEDGSLDVDNRKKEQVVGGTVDYYTRTEYDPVIDAIQETLEGLKDTLLFGWILEGVLFEDDTNTIHYTWSWSVA